METFPYSSLSILSNIETPNFESPDSRPKESMNGNSQRLISKPTSSSGQKIDGIDLL